MSIKFFCQCGKRLRARDEMAGRRSMCPRCGNPVGIPSLQADGRLGPMTPAERIKARQQLRPGDSFETNGSSEQHSTISDQTAAIVVPDFHTNLIRQAFSRKNRFHRRRGLETHWYECLLFPLRALPLIVVFAVLLTLLTVFAIALASEPEGDLFQRLIQNSLLSVSLGFSVVVIVSYACGFLDCTLASAAAGELPMIRWPGRNAWLALKSLMTWLACFLAGPIIPASVAYLYWTQCGDMEVVDWLILAELGIVALSYSLLAIVAVSVSDRLMDANPVQIIALVQRVGLRLPTVILVAAAVLLGHGLLAVKAIAFMHQQASAFLLLAGYWLSVFFLATFLFRLLGLWCYQTRVPAN
jgi:hypothetical protein